MRFFKACGQNSVWSEKTVFHVVVINWGRALPSDLGTHTLFIFFHPNRKSHHFQYPSFSQFQFFTNLKKKIPERLSDLIKIVVLLIDL